MYCDLLFTTLYAHVNLVVMGRVVLIQPMTFQHAKLFMPTNLHIRKKENQLRNWLLFLLLAAKLTKVLIT